MELTVGTKVLFRGIIKVPVILSRWWEPIQINGTPHDLWSFAPADKVPDGIVLPTKAIALAFESLDEIREDIREEEPEEIEEEVDCWCQKINDGED